MWCNNWRDEIWARLDSPWDVIVIGGGITGAGILREAARAGLRALLLEADDFASGTSSRSSKLVHGGFRYLKNAQIRLTLESVRERERLLREGRGLITQLGFLMPSFTTDPLPPWILEFGLTIYDLLALKWGHRYYDSFDLREFCPSLAEEGLRGGFRYFDAQTDDARLTLRVLREAVRAGGTALNYARAESLLQTRSGQVYGISVRDTAGCAPSPKTGEASAREIEIQAHLIINATGAWADDLRAQAGGKPRLRRLRGSHLLFPRHKFPLTRAVSLWHPRDGRPVFALPWEGVTLLGTTDVDHGAEIQTDPCISLAEAEYLLAAAHHVFPQLGLSLDDVQATFSGIRAVVDTGKANPSKESREFVLWNENSLLTITGGKLTTFRRMAHRALEAGRWLLPGAPHFDADLRVLDAPPEALNDAGLDRAARLRLLGRYGADAPQLIAAAGEGELTPIEPSPALWAELRWAARAEGVVHLDDLLLRRVRLGLLLPKGSLPWLPRIRSIVQPELGWDDERWEQEAADYLRLWERSYSLQEA